MKKGDTFLTPAIDFTDTKANIEAIASPVEAMVAQQTDSPYAQGHYANGAWVWGGDGDISGTGVIGQVAEFVTNTKNYKRRKSLGQLQVS